MQHPGHDTDVLVTTPTPVLARVFSGADAWSAAVRRGDLEVDGHPGLVRSLPTWFAWGPWADQTRERAARTTATG